MGKRYMRIAKPVFILGVVSLLTDLSSEMIYPILPLFLANTLGASTVFIGLIEGIAESTASLLKVFSGWLSDRLGKRKQLILAGYGFSSIVKPFFAIATSAWQVLGFRFLDRLGKGIRGAPRDAMIADVTEPSERGRAFGFHRAMDTVGAILGPGVTFVLLAVFHGSYRPIFLLSAIPAFIAVAVIIFMVRENVQKNPPHPPLSKGGDTVVPPFVKGGEGGFGFKQLPRNFIILLIIIGVFTLGNSSDAFLLLRAQGVGVSAGLIPLLWLFFNLTYTLTSIPAGSLSDRIGRKTVIIGGFVVYALSYAGFAFAKSPWHAWALFGIYGLYYGMTEGVLRAYIADVVPASIRATSFGVFNFVTGVLLFPANLLTGWIWKAYGATAAFGLGASLAIIAAAGFAVFSSLCGRSTKPMLQEPKQK